MIYTYADVVDNLIDYVGGGPAEQVVRDCRRAALEAYRDLVNAFKWPYLYRHGRVLTAAPFDGGGVATFAYDHSGGAYERMATISGATWPANAASCYLRASGASADVVAFRVASRVSGTVLTLDDQVNPGADLASGTAFTLYQDTYELPADFVSQDEALYELNFGGMSYVHPRDWLFENRYVTAQGTPQFFSITGDPQYPGRLAMRVFPWPDAARSIDFVYYRRPRPLAIQQVSAGTVATTSGSVAVVGTGTSFVPSMVGSVMRVSANPRTPSSAVGSVSGYNPPALEATVVAVASATALTLDAAAPSTSAGSGYAISDPIDFEAGAMLNAYLRSAEKCVAKLRSLKDKPGAAADYQVALNEARAASSPSFAGRHAGPRGAPTPAPRLPQGPDQP